MSDARLIDANALMEKFGGGGHFTAAAAQIDKSVEEVEEQLRLKVSDYMQKDSQDSE